MTKLVKYVLLFSMVITINGCTVGRFVTNISSNGADGLAVEKCTTKKWDMFFWDTECSSSTINLILPEVGQPQAIQQPIVQPVAQTVLDTMPSYEHNYQQPQANTSGKDLTACLALVDNALIAKCVRAAK